MLSTRQRRRERSVKMGMAVELQRSQERLAQQLKKTNRKGKADPGALFAWLTRPGNPSRRLARHAKAVRYFEEKVRPFTSRSR